MKMKRKTLVQPRIATTIHTDLHEEDSGLDENGSVGSDEDFNIAVHVSGKRRKSKRLARSKKKRW